MTGTHRKCLRVADRCVYIYRLESVMLADYWAHAYSSAVICFTVGAADASLIFALPFFSDQCFSLLGFLHHTVRPPILKPKGFQLFLFYLYFYTGHTYKKHAHQNKNFRSKLPHISHLLSPGDFFFYSCILLPHMRTWKTTEIFVIAELQKNIACTSVDVV